MNQLWYVVAVWQEDKPIVNFMSPPPHMGRYNISVRVCQPYDPRARDSCARVWPFKGYIENKTKKSILLYSQTLIEQHIYY